MSFLDNLIQHDGVLLYLLNLVIVVTLLAGWGLIAATLLPRRQTGLRSTVLVTVLALLVMAPLVPGLARAVGFAGLALPRSLVAASQDAQRPSAIGTMAMDDLPLQSMDITVLSSPSLDIHGTPDMSPLEILLASILGLWATGFAIGLF